MAQPQQKNVDNDAGAVFNGLNEQRSTGKYCDVIVVSGEQRIHSHRNVLATNSPYFDAIFTSDFSEKGQAEVDVTRRDGSGVDDAILELFINYFYMGSVTVDEGNVHSLLAGADFLMVTKVKESCAEFLQSLLSPANCLESWAIATKHSCKDLESAAFDYAQKCFYKIATSDDFLELSAKQLMALLNGDQLTARSEEDVCQAAFRWVRHLPDERTAHLLEILGSVRLAQCEEKFLVETLEAHSLIQKNEQCRRLIEDAKDQLRIFASSKDATTLKPADGRRSVAYKTDTLYAMGGFTNDQPNLNAVEKYDAFNNSFSNVAPMLKQRHAFGAVSIDDQIFVMGGITDDWTSSVERYDPFSDSWHSLAPMPTARAGFGVAVLNGQVYTVGGELKSREYSRVMERYDPVSDLWSTMAPMRSARSNCAAVALDGRLYVLGGWVYDEDIRDEVAVDSVEIFDPSTGRWSWSPSVPMPAPRSSFGCAVFGGKIFVAGGWRNADGIVSSVVSFDPIAQQWGDSGHLSSARVNLSLAVVDGHLLAIGGRASDGVLPVSTVDTLYMPDTKIWHHLGDMIEARYCHGVAVI